MPLIIIILIITVGLIVVRESDRERARIRNNETAAFRKTNAELELEVMDSFIKKGQSFDESFELTIKKIVGMGYDPCIPKSAYKDYGGSDYCISNVRDPGRYDSDAVKDKIWQYETFKKKMGKFFTDSVTYNEYVYDNFYKSKFAYSMDPYTHLASILWSLNDYVFSNTFGTCEVVGYNVGQLGIPYSYQLKVLKTGEVINTQCIDDKRFVHGQR